MKSPQNNCPDALFRASQRRVEEIGEVAACLTYDNDAETGHSSDLESEVIQVIALALAWATRYLDD